MNASNNNNRENIRIHDIVMTLWNRRGRIIGLTIIFILLSAGYALMQQDKYVAVATILPESEDRTMGQFAQFAGVMSMVGLSPAQLSETEVYPAMMKSETILHDVIYKKYETDEENEPVNLIEFWDVRGRTDRERYQETLRKLREEVLSISIARDSRVISITVETQNPYLSAKIANSIADKLDEYVLTKRRTRASQQRQWLDLRLAEVNTDLLNAEEALKDFRLKNRRIGDSPELLMEQERLLRDIELHAGVFLELTKQHEMIKVQEIRDMPVVQVLDYATPPVDKSNPGKPRILLVGALLGFFTGVLSVYGNRLLNVSTEDNRSLVRKILNDVKSDITNVFGGGHR